MTKSATICDGCGATKGEANHWRIVALYSSGVIALAAKTDELPAYIRPPKIMDVCGETCEQTIIDRLRRARAVT